MALLSENSIWAALPFLYYQLRVPDLRNPGTVQITWSNVYTRKTTGYSLSRMQRLGYAYFCEVVHPNDLHLAQSLLHLAMHSKEPVCQLGLFRIKTVQGDYQWYYSKLCTIFSDQRECHNPFVLIALPYTLTLYSSKLHQRTEPSVGDRYPDVDSKVLTRREKEVIYLISKGFTNKQIAAKLFISQHTAQTHRSNLLKKTGCTKTVQLIVYAVENGLHV